MHKALLRFGGAFAAAELAGWADHLWKGHSDPQDGGQSHSWVGWSVSPGLWRHDRNGPVGENEGRW